MSSFCFNSSSVTALFYRLSVSVSASFTHTVKALTTVKGQLTSAQLSAKVTFRRADDSSYLIIERSAVKTVQRYDNMFSLYCKTKVVKSDFEAFALNLKSFFTSKLSTGRSNLLAQLVVSLWLRVEAVVI